MPSPSPPPRPGSGGIVESLGGLLGGGSSGSSTTVEPAEQPASETDKVIEDAGKALNSLFGD